MKEKMTIIYSCPLCGLDKAETEVDEDVSVWMGEVVALALFQDHRRRSPFCTSKNFKDLMIPLSGRAYIGGPLVH